MAAVEVAPAPSHQSSQFLPPQQTVTAASESASWANANPPLSRGRQPKDPQAVTSRFECANLHDLERNLRVFLDSPPADPEHSTCELTIWAGASFMVQVPVEAGAPSASEPASGRSEASMQTVAMSVLDALQPAGPDPKETMKRQRSVAKVCVASIQKVDGFRYSFHNSWRSGEDDAYRFSFYCNDSLLNKDRVASGKSGSSGKRAHKPVYDCKGVLSIKFSATRQCIDVLYKHVPLHATYEERAPRPRKEAKRRAEWELQNPEKVKKPKPPAEEAGTKKRQKKPRLTHGSLESELLEESKASLLELIRIGQEAQTPPQTSPPSAPPPPPPEQNDSVEQRAMAALTLNANNDLRKEVEVLKKELDAIKKELEDERRKCAGLQERCTQLEAENSTLRGVSAAPTMQDPHQQSQPYPAQPMPMGTRRASSQTTQGYAPGSEHQMYPNYSARPRSEYLCNSTWMERYPDFALVPSHGGPIQVGSDRQSPAGQWPSNYYQDRPPDPSLWHSTNMPTILR